MKDKVKKNIKNIDVQKTLKKIDLKKNYFKRRRKMNEVKFGIDQIKKSEYSKMLEGNVALLAHSASFNSNLVHSAQILKDLLGDRLIKLFGLNMDLSRMCKIIWWRRKILFIHISKYPFTVCMVNSESPQKRC